MNIIIFYKEENEERHILVANCEKDVEETSITITSLVVFF
jgi:hypothetical protein